MKDYINIKNIDDFNLLLLKAENGDSEAMNEVSGYYEDGWSYDKIEIVKCDKKLAFYWTKRSYESGNIDGMVRYANYLNDGIYEHCDKDIELAMKLYEKAMNNGSEIATFNLGIEYRNKQQFEKAFELYKKADSSENYYAELTVGLCYYYGIGTKKNKLKALEFFKSIDKHYNSEYDIDEANYFIGKMYLEGEVVEQSIETARKYLELADKDGDHRSAQELLLIIGRTRNIN
ncbi:MAG: sel1 repeat family protein [Sphingobacteriales bacterium]|nr:MAG: sel1 repeat family protein [Sphingobacteriales bacterium]